MKDMINVKTRTGKEIHRAFNGSVRTICGVRAVVRTSAPVTCKYCGPDKKE